MTMPEGPVQAQHRIAMQYLDSVSAGERYASGSAMGWRLEFYPSDYPMEPPTPGFKVRRGLASPQGIVAYLLLHTAGSPAVNVGGSIAPGPAQGPV